MCVEDLYHVLAVVNWRVTPNDAVCCAILGVRVLLLEMKIKWCVERKMRWPEENKMMEEQEKYEG